MKDLNGYDTFRMFQAIKQHLTQKNFDYYKYNKKSKVNISTYNKRNDKNLFEKAGKQRDIEIKLIFLLSRSPDKWINDIFDSSFDKDFSQFHKRYASLEYSIKEELKNLSSVCHNFNDMMYTNGEIPYILSKYLEGKVSLELLSILIHLTSSWKPWNVHLKDNIIWTTYKYRLIKYHSFLEHKYNKKNIVTFIMDNFV